MLIDTEYSYNGKSVTELIDEYVVLYNKYESIKDTISLEEKALSTAQKNMQNQNITVIMKQLRFFTKCSSSTKSTLKKELL